ncbi:MAG: ATP-grasp domain-containing protein [Pseudomonadota bacterium]
MKILLLEYITAGGFGGEPLPASLLREGALMRDALVHDFSTLEDVSIVTTYDARLDAPKLGGSIIQAVRVEQASDALATWQQLLKTCDAAVVVAPETDGILAYLMQMIEAAGVKNLGCLSSAVKTTSSKYDTYQQLKSANILTLATYTVNAFLQADFSQSQLGNDGWIVKPSDGAGCEDTFYFDDEASLREWLRVNQQAVQQRQAAKQFIVQPYQTGTPASISMLCKNGAAWLLSCNQQTIAIVNDNAPQASAKPSHIQYQGCMVNGLSQHANAFSKLASDIAAAMPDLNGYIGVDVIVSHDDIYVVEINPRITTSYIGLRESLGVNPAKLMLDIAYSQSTPESLSQTFELPVNMTTKPVEINLNA